METSEPEDAIHHDPNDTTPEDEPDTLKKAIKKNLGKKHRFRIVDFKTFYRQPRNSQFYKKYIKKTFE